MIKAVFKQGTIQLLQPPPPEWVEGAELNVDLDVKTHPRAWIYEHRPDWPPPLKSLDGPDQYDLTPGELEIVSAELDALCSQGDPAQDAIMMQAIAEHRAQQKELMRKRMGLA